MHRPTLESLFQSVGCDGACVASDRRGSGIDPEAACGAQRSVDSIQQLRDSKPRKDHKLCLKAVWSQGDVRYLLK